MTRQAAIVAALVALAAALALVSGNPRLALSDTSTLKYRAVAPFVARDVAEAAPTPPVAPDPGPPAPGGPSSYDLINQALEKSEITAEQAAIYRVFASFADPRLPHAFNGNDEDLPDSVDLFADFDSLSSSAKALLAPFRLRPDHPDSWWYSTDAGEWPGMSGASATGDVQASARPAGPWLHVSGTKVRVHYPNVGNSYVLAGLATYAGTILNEAETVIWPKLTSLLGREPLPDCLLVCGDVGGSSRYDIYLVSVNRSYVQPEFTTCSAAGPSYMALNPARTFGTLAHELMHSFQFSFTMGGSGACGEYRWLEESTAQWAVDSVYKKTYNAYEQRVLPDFVDHSRQPLEFENDKHEYGAYIFFFYLTRVGGVAESVIKDIWAAATNSDSLKAVDGAIPGGFARHWQEFVKYNWNPNPPWAPLDQYRTLDDNTYHAARQSGFAPKAVSASPDQQVPLSNSELVHLSSAYYEFTFDSSVSTLAFLNGFTYELKIENIDGAQVFTSTELGANEPVKKYGRVQALIKRVGKDWEMADWSNSPSRIFCLDDPNDRVERLVIILSNSDPDRNNLPIKPVNLSPRLWASNMGCWKWQGTASYISADGMESISANVTWEFAGAQSGRPGTIGGAAAGQKYGAIGLFYLPLEGSITLRAQGTDSSGCVHSGGATLNFASQPAAQNVLVSFNLVPGGQYHRVYAGAGFTSEVKKSVDCPSDGEGPDPGPDIVPMNNLWFAAGSEDAPLTVTHDGRRMVGGFGGGADEAKWQFDFKALKSGP